MNEAKLKACPFCGGDAESDMTQGFRRMMDGVISKAVAICLRCSAQITMCHDDHKEYAPEDMLTILTDAWNIRAGDRQPEATPNDEAIASSLQRVVSRWQELLEYKARMEWLHDCSSGVTDQDGCEWGIYRVKWENGKAIEVWQTNSDFSDLDAEMAREKAANDQAQAQPPTATPERKGDNQ